jgi:hypothetical protein
MERFLSCEPGNGPENSIVAGGEFAINGSGTGQELHSWPRGGLVGEFKKELVYLTLKSCITGFERFQRPITDIPQLCLPFDRRGD